MPLLIGLMAFGIRAYQPGVTTETSDEALWLVRTEVFTHGLLDGELADMTASWEPRQRRMEALGLRAEGGRAPASTMPGVTTMWAGALGRGLALVSAAVGISDDPGDIRRSPQTLRAARLVVSTWCAIAITALVALLAWLVGRRAAALTGLLLALEPFLAGHSHLLHTDALVTATGSVAVVALMVALWGRRPRPGGDPPERGIGDAGRPDTVSVRGRRWLLVLAGVAGGLCVLTKLNGLALVGPAMAIALLTDAVSRRRREPGGPWWPTLRAAAIAGTAVAGVLALTVFLLWPALWVDPTGQLRAIQRTLDLVRGNHPVFFFGKLTRRVDARFYFVTTIFRASPWLLIGFPAGLALVVVAFARRWPDRPDGRVLLTVAGGSAAYLAAIIRTPMKYDRYALPLWTWMALIFALGIVLVVDRLPSAVRTLPRPALAGAGVVTIALLAWVSLAYAPYATSYVDPLVGGQGAAAERIPLGWGEGLEQAGTLIAEREAPGLEFGQEPPTSCFRLRIWWINPTMMVAFPCAPLGQVQPVKVRYFIRYVTIAQRRGNRRRPAGYKHLETVRIGGQPYVEMWVKSGSSKSPSPSASSSGAGPPTASSYGAHGGSIVGRLVAID